jgi:hypothetical protein
LREADFDCARYGTCYDPSPVTPSGWLSLEAVAVILLILLIVALLISLAKPAEKPKPSIKTAVNGVIDDLEKQANLWNRPEAMNAFQSARGRINKEFDERDIK